MNKLLVALRESKGWTPTDVYGVLDISESEYSDLENGKQKVNIPLAIKLGELYHLTPEYFIGDVAKYVNYNSGMYSKGVVNAHTYNEGKDDK